MAEETIFAKIIRGDVEADIVYQDDLVTAFRDISPQAPVHILIVTNRAIPTVNDVTPDDEAALGRLFTVAAKLAQDEGIGVLVYLPFGRSRMWARIGDRPLPEWAAEFDAHTWAQLMLKFVVAHPAVTVACPGTGDPAHMIENLGGGRGRLPTPEHARRIVELVDALPMA